MKTLVLIDGEHYPPVTRWGLDVARQRGLDPVACLLVGGTEKLGPDRSLDLGDLPLERLEGGLADGLRVALRRHRPEAILDLSDEPVLGYRERMLAAAVTLAAGLPYLGPDFRLDPPVEGPPLRTPAVAVIGTGKRTGKTAVAAETARVTAAAGFDPVVVAMGRGGPPEPEVAEPGEVNLDRLLSLARAGRHAASDYLEDALTSGVPTIGARRVGGGLAGRPFASTVREAATLAERRGAGLVILEGSGAAVPPVPWDAGILLCPATLPPEFLGGYLGPYRLLLSDVVLLTMSVGPDVGPRDLTHLTSHVRRVRPDARIVVTDFRPVPLGEVRGKKVFFTTTAPELAGPRLTASLEERHGCTVVGTSHRLGDRAALADDLDAAPPYDALLTEVKAAAVDVAAERALARGAEVVFVDNRPYAFDAGDDLRGSLLDLARLAAERAEDR